MPGCVSTATIQYSAKTIDPASRLVKSLLTYFGPAMQNFYPNTQLPAPPLLKCCFQWWATCVAIIAAPLFYLRSSGEVLVTASLILKALLLFTFRWS